MYLGVVLFQAVSIHCVCHTERHCLVSHRDTGRGFLWDSRSLGLHPVGRRAASEEESPHPVTHIVAPAGTPALRAVLWPLTPTPSSHIYPIGDVSFGEKVSKLSLGAGGCRGLPMLSAGPKLVQEHGVSFVKTSQCSCSPWPTENGEGYEQWKMMGKSPFWQSHLFTAYLAEEVCLQLLSM